MRKTGLALDRRDGVPVESFTFKMLA
jgi:hypothetical protein